MIVKEQKQIEIINNCGAVVDLKKLKKAIEWYSEKPVARLKTIYMHGCYPAVSIHLEKIHIHRLLMMYWLDRKLETREYVHHKDHNKLNSLKSNLELIERSKHQSFHNKGKRLSEGHKEKIALANKKRKGMRMKKKVNIPVNELRTFLKKGKSINYIAKHYGCDWSTVKSRIYDNPELLEV